MDICAIAAKLSALGLILVQPLPYLRTALGRWPLRFIMSLLQKRRKDQNTDCLTRIPESEKEDFDHGRPLLSTVGCGLGTGQCSLKACRPVGLATRKVSLVHLSPIDASKQVSI